MCCAPPGFTAAGSSVVRLYDLRLALPDFILFNRYDGDDTPPTSAVPDFITALAIGRFSCEPVERFGPNACRGPNEPGGASDFSFPSDGGGRVQENASIEQQ
ncbi:hypothetical protein EVAR_70817_1 [Eumeta japonica]|uniref:Uncharacterized protein n=1 Tax=Eumeta variegata TaxID=151549 RepID=A0A4C2A885_EUMVA|nr:hypothetical protein EVAR_70817_1 [Eumeta japonica]